MVPSVFTRIINGEIPCHKIYEDNETIAFLDIHPIQPGHILVVPKTQVTQFTNMDTESYLNLMNVSHRLAKHLQKTLGCHRVVLRIEGFDVAHTHVHLIPCQNHHDSFKIDRDDIKPEHTELASMAQKLVLKG